MNINSFSQLLNNNLNEIKKRKKNIKILEISYQENIFFNYIHNNFKDNNIEYLNLNNLITDNTSKNSLDIIIKLLD